MEYRYSALCDSNFIQVGDKYGFINDNGVPIGEIKYDDICSFYDGYACVGINKKYGQIDKNGIEVIKCEHYFYDVHIIYEKYKQNQLRIQKLKTII